MAKKSTRVLSFILSALLLVSMLPVVSLAEEAKYYNFDEEAATKNYYTKLDYSALVGPEYQNETKNVIIINKSWNYKSGSGPKSVSFTFRDEKVTESYDANRHMASISNAVKYVKDNAVKNPIFILTAGVYSDVLKMADGFTVLGPKAGMNPNVPDADPTKEWELSDNRKMPTASSANGEAVFRIEGGMGGDHLIFGDKNSVGVQNYIVDGVVFQGNGSGIEDESEKGSGTRNWYVQNCIFDDCYSEGGRGNSAGLGFDRRSSQTYIKNLYVSNCYMTNQNTKPLYSGHATSVNFNGIAFQNSVYSLAYKFAALQWQGHSVSITNSHFWNPKGSTRSGHVFNLSWEAYCSSGVGNDGVLFAANVRNNSFYHMNRDGSYMLKFGIAGNTKVNIEENIFISEEGNAASAPFQMQYITVDGVVTHVGIGETVGDSRVAGLLVNSADYKVTNEQFMVRNNTFVGKEFQALPTIGNNTNAETKVEMTGNLYLDSMTSTQGKIIDPYTEGAKIYNKWVWLDAARTEASSAIAEGDVKISADGHELDLSGYDLSLSSGTSYEKQINVTCNSENYVRVYKSDASWSKGEKISGTNNFTLPTTNRKNYFIIAITSMDERTELNYRLTVDRDVNPDAKLNKILPQGSVLSSSTDGTNFNYEVAYKNSSFAFKLDANVTGITSIWNMSGILSPNSKGVYTIEGLKVGEETTYEIWLEDAAKNREVYYLNVTRAENTETDLLGVDASAATSITSLGKTYTLKVPTEVKTLLMTLNLSDGATAEVLDPIYKMPIKNQNGVFTVDPVLGGENTYEVIVTSQDGEYSEEWTIVIDREAKKDCELLSIAGTEKVGNMYVGYTANKEFLISATISEGATYKIYTDPTCIEALSSPRVSLTETTNTFWIKVFAEDTAYASEPIKVLINTFADTTEKEETPVKLPMNDDEILGVTGGEFDGNEVVVPLAPETKQYTFRVQGFDGYVARVYSDQSETPMRPANTVDLTLDSGKTILYVTATKGSGANKIVKEYTVYIISPRTYTYTDKQVDWAADYVAEVGSNGWGLMKGYTDGSFGGDKEMTRYEMAAMMVRVAGANVHLYAQARNPFSDEIAEWALGYVKAASRMGMVKGYEVATEEGAMVFEFQGDNNSTRSEFFRTFTNAVIGYDVDEYYAARKDTIDRAVNRLGIADLADIPDWAIPAVYTALYKKLVVGDHNKNVNPTANITRYEVAVVLGRYYDTL